MPGEETDDQLVSRVGKGDAEALGGLARRYEGPLIGLARGLLSGRDDLARDAVQETWIKCIRFATHFSGRSSVRTWLYRIAINKCNDIRASRLRHDPATNHDGVLETEPLGPSNGERT